MSVVVPTTFEQRQKRRILFRTNFSLSFASWDTDRHCRQRDYHGARLFFRFPPKVRKVEEVNGKRAGVNNIDIEIIRYSPNKTAPGRIINRSTRHR